MKGEKDYIKRNTKTSQSTVLKTNSVKLISRFLRHALINAKNTPEETELPEKTTNLKKKLVTAQIEL